MIPSLLVSLPRGIVVIGSATIVAAGIVGCYRLNRSFSLSDMVAKPRATLMRSLFSNKEVPVDAHPSPVIGFVPAATSATDSQVETEAPTMPQPPCTDVVPLPTLPRHPSTAEMPQPALSCRSHASVHPLASQAPTPPRSTQLVTLKEASEARSTAQTTITCLPSTTTTRYTVIKAAATPCARRLILLPSATSANAVVVSPSSPISKARSMSKIISQRRLAADLTRYLDSFIRAFTTPAANPMPLRTCHLVTISLPTCAFASLPTMAFPLTLTHLELSCPGCQCKTCDACFRNANDDHCDWASPTKKRGAVRPRPSFRPAPPSAACDLRCLFPSCLEEFKLVKQMCRDEVTAMIACPARPCAVFSASTITSAVPPPPSPLTSCDRHCNCQKFLEAFELIEQMCRDEVAAMMARSVFPWTVSPAVTTASAVPPPTPTSTALVATFPPTIMFATNEVSERGAEITTISPSVFSCDCAASSSNSPCTFAVTSAYSTWFNAGDNEADRFLSYFDVFDGFTPPACTPPQCNTTITTMTVDRYLATLTFQDLTTSPNIDSLSSDFLPGLYTLSSTPTTPFTWPSVLASPDADLPCASACSLAHPYRYGLPPATPPTHLRLAACACCASPRARCDGHISHGQATIQGDSVASPPHGCCTPPTAACCRVTPTSGESSAAVLRSGEGPRMRALLSVCRAALILEGSVDDDSARAVSNQQAIMPCALAF